MEAQIIVSLECTESSARQIIRSTTSVQLDGRDVSELALPDEAYALLDHAFRKIDEAHDQAKSQLRTTAKMR